MARDLNKHQCPIAGCKELLPNSKLMCLTHWRMVPEPLQRDVNKAYDHGAGLGSSALLNAQMAAIGAVEARLAARKDSR